MKLTTKQLDKYLDFMNYYKPYVGLSDWIVTLKVKLIKGGDLAGVLVEAHEKEMILTISEEFLKETDKKQLNILFHELVHARVACFNQRAREHTYILEEDMVNDLTRGYEELTRLKWQG